MKTICLQVGHMNAKFGDDWLKPMTGAPLEEPKNKAIAFRTAEMLRERGHIVIVTDSNGYKDETVTESDFDLFLAIHCDADSASTGGFTDYPNPDDDGATVLSQLYADRIADKFYPESGITFRPERRGQPSCRYYYFWQYLTGPTPCVIIEMGESIDPHDSVILNDTERCAMALTRGICNALNVPYEIVVEPPTPPEPEPPVNPCSEISSQLERALNKLNRIREILGEG
jgi:N-acetylmuramoyl-L-alanine amidase